MRGSQPSRMAGDGSTLSRPAGAAATAVLPATVLASYAIAQFGLSAMNTLVSTQIPFFYVDTLRLPATSFGVIMLLGKLWDAVTDPLMGHVTDNTRSRLGRRRPYFLIGAPLLGLFTFLLFNPPESLSGDALFPWLLFTYLAAYTARTVFETPYQAMAPDLTPDYDQRTRVATWRVTIGNLGDLLGAVVPMALLAVLAPRTTFRISGGVVAAVIILTAIVTFWRVGERTDLRDAPRAPLGKNLWQIVTFPVRNRPARLLIASYACAVFAMTLPVAVFRFVNKYVFTATGLEATWLGPTIESIGKNAFLDLTVILGYFVGVFLSAPLWARALRKWDKKQGYLLAFCSLGVAVLGIFLIPRDMGFLFPLQNVFVGACGLGLWMLPGAIGPDVLEWEELHHGHRHEGGFYGIWMFVQKTGGGIALFAMASLLDGIGFVPDIEQTAETVRGLRWLYAGTPLAAAGIAVAIFVRYPITRERFREIQAALAAKRASGGDET